MENNNHIQPRNRFVTGGIIFSIVIVLNLFFNYAISLVYKQPVFTSFYSNPQVVNGYSNKGDCLTVGGQWSESSIIDPKGITIQGICNPDFTNQKNYEQARKIYDKNVFIILIILGVISIGFGVFIKNTMLKISLVLGGLLSLLIATLRYWSDAGNFIKVFILGLALFGLVWLVLKKFKE